MLDDTLLRHALRKALPRPRRPTSRRILVAARDPARAGAIGGWLVGAGYDVAVAATAAEAEQLEETFDCAVLDYELADGSGIMLAASLSARDQLSSVVFSPDAIGAEGDDSALESLIVERLAEIEANVEAALSELKSSQHRAA
jgi:CheY-like chemotaxis protein